MDFSYSQQSLSPTVSFQGAILLDVENFPFKLDLAQQLKAYYRYPVTVKFAVANWQNSSISKLDKHFHQQGYQLIHVPKGKNAADGQLLTLGASLLVNYPRLREVAIVSQDCIFNYLHQTLHAQGCNTYKIYHRSGNIYLDDYAASTSSVIAKIEATKKQHSPEQDLQTKIESIISKLTEKESDNITLSKVSQQFKLEYKQSISEALKSHKLSKSALSFIKKSCSNTVNIQEKNKIYYLNLINR